MHRFYYEKPVNSQKIIVDDFKDVKYIRTVLRLKEGEEVEFFDGKGKIFKTILTLLTNDRVEARVEENWEESEKFPYLFLAQALPKAGKLDEIIQDGTEVGVSEFYLFESDNSVAKLKDFRSGKLERFNKIAQEAARQSERSIVPVVNEPKNFKQMLDINADIKLLLHSREHTKTSELNEIKKQITLSKKVLVLIGPEGGFSEYEVNTAVENGFKILHLGLPIMRTETAGAVVAGILLA